MSNYFIAYDLMAPGKHYAKVEEAIKSFNLWAHVQASLWYVKSDLTPNQVRDHILKSMDANDKLIVMQCAEAAWYGITDEVSNYMKTNWSK